MVSKTSLKLNSLNCCSGVNKQYKAENYQTQWVLFTNICVQVFLFMRVEWVLMQNVHCVHNRCVHNYLFYSNVYESISFWMSKAIEYVG